MSQYEASLCRKCRGTTILGCSKNWVMACVENAISLKQPGKMLPCLHCGKRPLCNLFKRCCQDQFKDKKRLIQSEKMLPGPHDIKNSFYNLARCCQDCMMAKTHCPILRQKRLFQFSKMMPRPHMMARCCHYRMWQKTLSILARCRQDRIMAKMLLLTTWQDIVSSIIWQKRHVLTYVIQSAEK